ncbi:MULTISPECIES: S9 family peptidase [Pseudonocardia]|uniref:Prolyl tripeptidyl peptidase n=2 Tax=Pseudonocardia TaxID=1847 RepID=A0A1Y2MLF2_PSEAH|nr:MULTISPECIES: S9 family peptidase [Pseudonocardia]OSY35288.1 Prolyl tripeptidyl peptidase precursor [Pseudonocardia autotrophica]TDN73273.1 dipeptidyl aminopeptidase/acylaminoacyl peptidase [Pseudonocardia autotrophica]BBG04009.1 putative peptidase [Pseudonocardia autotrophica]GEC27739.1 putative peptidase [Pseudonocardia saturnea]
MTTPPPLITVEEFFDAPVRSSARISPDGTKVAYLAPWRNRLNVFVRDVDGDWPGGDASDDPASRRVTSDDHRSIETFFWSADSRFLLFTQDTDGDENAHLHRADLSRPDEPTVDLTPIAGARVMGAQLTPDPGTVVVQLNARSPELVDLHELDLDTGRLTLIAANPGDVLGWLRMPTGRIVAFGLDDDGTHLLSDWNAGEPRVISRISGFDQPFGILPAVPTPDGTGLWTGSVRGSDRNRLVRIDLDTGEQIGVDSHPVFDLDALRPEADPRYPSSLIVHPGTGELLGARYLGARQVIHPLDPHFAEVLPRLAELSDGDLAHVSCDTTGRRWVVDFTHDRDHRATWFYDHATGTARRLFRPYPHLDPARLAPVTPVTITARDGIDLPCHLTLPIGTEHRDLPTVVLLHGGPWYRDSWTYDPEVQLLANRGYAVLQVNFRGSTGYGKAHMQAAIGQFAGRMHDDVIDALDWAIAQGYTDRDRVAIYGSSYGGYAALVGAAFTPDRFAAAISYTGMSDLVDISKRVLPFVRRAVVNSFGRYMGDPDDPAQEADMYARSPITRVDDITAPVLLVHGANDLRVHRSNSDRVAEALRARGAEVEYLLNEREGHWFVNPDSNIELYRTLEQFLARHLGGRTASEA